MELFYHHTSHYVTVNLPAIYYFLQYIGIALLLNIKVYLTITTIKLSITSTSWHKLPINMKYILQDKMYQIAGCDKKLTLFLRCLLDMG